MIALDHKDRAFEGRWGCLANGQRWSFYYLEKVYGVNEGEELLEGFNRYDLVNLEAKDTESISRIMGILVTLVGDCQPSKSKVVRLVEGDYSGIDYN